MKHSQLLEGQIDLRKSKVKILNAKVIKSFDTQTLKSKSVSALVPLLISPISITSIANTIGTNVLSGNEDLSISPSKINKKRIEVGLEMVKAALEARVIKKYRQYKQKGKGGKDEIIPVNQRKMMLKLEEKAYGFVMFSLECDDEQEQNWTSVALERPEQRVKFAQYESGNMVKLINYKNCKRLSLASCPIAYAVINKVQGVPLEVNQEALYIYNRSQHHKLFRGNSKLDDEQRASFVALNDAVLTRANGIGGALFYHYYQYDFRGRLYPSTNFFSFTGSKLAKSLHLFANKKRLGESGWRWLLIHTANTYGFDTASLNERYKFINNKLEFLMEIIANPVDNIEWWSKADDPFCFLAALLEIRNALACENKEDYISGLPISLDATCSGAQVMSLLSRDEVTGALCNLIPSKTRADYYLNVADYVWKELLKGKTGDYWKKYHSKRRKLVKRSVMTWAYSCQGDSMGEHIMDDFATEEWIEGLNEFRAKYLGRLIYKACRKLMPGIAKMMDLFIEIGGRAADKAQDLQLVGHYSGFFFSQFYRRHQKGTITFEKQRLKYYSVYNKSQRKSKVASSSSPNIVHFLDAQIVSKLVMLADYDLLCVHDSFSSVAADAEQLYNDTRTATIELFTPDVLKDICEQTDTMDLYDGIEFGSLVVEDLAKNQYCYS